MKKHSAILGVAMLLGLFGIPNSVLGQEKTPAKIISDVIGVGKNSFLKDNMLFKRRASAC